MKRLAGVSSEVIRAAVKVFKAVEHRLEFVREVHGVRYYNDSKATNVDATEKAIAAFAGGVHVILGGKDKDSDYSVLAPLLRERVKTVITIGSAAEKIKRQLAGVVKIESAETLQRAVAADGKACIEPKGTMVEEARRARRRDWREIGFHLAVLELGAFKERNHLVENAGVAGHGHIVDGDIGQPDAIVGNPRPDAVAGRWQPPMLHVALRKLAPGGSQDLCPRQFGFCHAERHDVL